MGGQKHTWVRPLGVCSLTHACAEGQEGGKETLRHQVPLGLTPPTHTRLYERAQATSLTA